jgi:hypothetical protein
MRSVRPAQIARQESTPGGLTGRRPGLTTAIDDHTMFTGFSDSGRIRRNRTDWPDSEPVQNVNIRTKPQHMDSKPRA